MPNHPPLADDQALGTAEDTPLPVTLTGSDPDGNPLTFSVLSQPLHGALSGGAPSLTYTPAANYSGADSFSFKANDGSLDLASATVSLTVAPVNDAPVADRPIGDDPTGHRPGDHADRQRRRRRPLELCGRQRTRATAP